MKTHKHRRLYYVPGLISLVLLPIVFYYCATNFLASTTFAVLPVNWFNPEDVKRYPELFHGSYPAKRDYLKIVLTGDENTDKIKIDFAQIRIREILLSKDTTNGVHFLFEDSAKYWALIKSLDVLNIEKAIFMPYESNIWFFHFNPKPVPENKMTGLGCCLCNDNPEFPPPIPWWQEQLTSAKAIWQSSWKLILAYGAFLLCLIVLKTRRGSLYL